MEELDIVVPVRNEEENILPLCGRLDAILTEAGITYRAIFIIDPSTDKTYKKLLEAQKRFPILVLRKMGKPGKAFSLLEGLEKVTTDYVAMLDGDLQYPPEAIPEMLRQAKEKNLGVVIASRQSHEGSLSRKIISKTDHYLVNRLILNINADVQSGLKLFRKEIVPHLEVKKINAWSFDAPLVYTAREMGFEIGSVAIKFAGRENGKSKVSFIKTTAQILGTALKLRFSGKKVYPIAAVEQGSMIGAGVAHKGHRFVTHTTLPNSFSALVTITRWQKYFLGLFVFGILAGLIINTPLTIIIFLGILSFIYLADVIFTLTVVLKSLHFPPEISFPAVSYRALKPESLPLYSILCPLYREAKVLPQFVAAISKLDWPKDKLDVLLLLEENDQSTIDAAKSLNLPSYFRIVVVPHSLPKTKPKACNYGLSVARGDFVVIYDAEDIPDPLQLKKAYLGFCQSGAKVACLQAKLNYYNPHNNLLTRLFTAEYSLWFDVVLPGFQSIDTTIPLGGTSNHFRTAVLRELRGWDPFNVTEDADLGVRLFKAGYKTAMIDSTTLEEANSKFGNWLRQRSRWIKGYFQTYLVHMRDPISFARRQGFHAVIFQMVIGARTTFMLINPILWAATILYFTAYKFVGPAIEALYPAPVFYMAVISLVFGNFLYLFNYMIGSAKREHWSVIKYVYLVPFYWLMVSIAAVMAAVQLVVKPHFWEKTVHGFHLETNSETPSFKFIPLRLSSEYISAGFLIVASLAAYFFNFLYNAYLSRAVSVEDFGLVSLVGSFVYLSQVPISALGRTFTYQSAFLFGKHETLVRSYWQKIRGNAFKISLIVSGFWLLLSPFMRGFFQANSLLPFFIFTPVWVIGSLQSVDQGYLTSGLRFQWLAILAVAESIIKLCVSVALVHFGFDEWVYLAVPLSMFVSFAVGYVMARGQKTKEVVTQNPAELHQFSAKFFATSGVLKLSSIAFLSLDLILAKHFLSPVDAGQYGYLSLVGKMVFFIGGLFTQFILPTVGKVEGAGRNTRPAFNKLLILTVLAGLGGYVAFGLLGFITVPILWGPNTNAILPLLPVYCAGMVFYLVASTIVSYHQIHNRHVFPALLLILSLLQIAGIIQFHGSVETIAVVVAGSGVISFGLVVLVDFFYQPLRIIGRNMLDFAGLFLPISKKAESQLKSDKKRILIFNWRDTKHVWAGGAEVYIHELAKRWVKMGHRVTVFCGNDGQHDRFETVDGVNIVRRGGFYFVYVWAVFYYIFRLRGKYDVIIDAENGIPFFTPLFAWRTKKFLLIHHVHQDVFRVNFKPPVSWVGAFLEKRVMPFVYQNTEVITVSPSSKMDILDNRLTKSEPHIIYNGVDLSLCQPGIKSDNPTVLYLGRIRTHKSLDIFVMVAKKVLKKIPNVEFIIAGSGQEETQIKKLVNKLGLEKKVKMLGKVTEEEKIKLYQKAWVFVNTSLMEGWGITTIEANACGTPVVASNVPGLRDAVHNPHSGVLVPYGDIDGFAKQVMTLIKDDKLRRQMSLEATTWARNFDWDKSAELLSVILTNQNE